MFQSALTDRSAPFSVLYVYGLGGVGKSALLGECAREAARAGMLTVRLDGRSIEASPGGFFTLWPTRSGSAIPMRRSKG